MGSVQGGRSCPQWSRCRKKCGDCNNNFHDRHCREPRTHHHTISPQQQTGAKMGLLVSRCWCSQVSDRVGCIRFSCPGSSHANAIFLGVVSDRKAAGGNKRVGRHLFCQRILGAFCFTPSLQPKQQRTGIVLLVFMLRGLVVRGFVPRNS